MRRLLKYVFSYLKSWFLDKTIKPEIDDELNFHLEMSTAEKMRAGMTSAEARREADQQFGRIERIREACRDIRGIGLAEALVQDVRYGLRTLFKNPGLTTVIVLTLSLGIGANTALFSAVDKVILRPLPLKDSKHLLVIRETNPQRPALGVSGPVFQQLLALTNVFENAAAYTVGQLAFIKESAPRLIWGSEVTPNFFSWFRAKPLLGRTFASDEGEPGRRDVVVITYGFWQREFGGDPGIIGKTIPLSNEPFLPSPGTAIQSVTVVGVMPPEFQFPGWSGNRCHFWRPMDLAAETLNGPFDRHMRNWTMLGRLRPDVTPTHANVVFDTLSQRNAAEFVQSSKDWRIEARALSSVFCTADFRLTIVSLFTAIVIVLLLACANAANLLLARAEDRQREFAIRAAIGAARGRLVRQLLTESTVLASLGAVMGSLIAIWGTRLLSANLPPELPKLREITVDIPALGFGVFLAMLTSIFFGLAPAWRAGRTSAGEMLRDAGYAHTLRSERLFFQRAMVVAQIALSLGLLAGAGLMFRSVSRFLDVRPGYDPKGLLVFMVTHFNDEPATVTVKLRRIQEAFLALPGVTSAAISRNGFRETVTLDGQEKTYHFQHTLVGAQHADFFSTYGIPLRYGRTFTQEDISPGNTSVMINQTMARILWPGQSAVGRWFNAGESRERFQVVGVVGDIVENPERPPGPRYYEPHERVSQRSMESLVTLRIKSDPAALIPSVRKTLWELDRSMIPPEIMFPEHSFQSLVLPRQTFMQFLGFFALAGLALASIGIYGLLAHLVARRTREIGVRMALGADRRNVLSMVLGQGALLIATGVMLGSLGSLAAVRFIQSKLFDISPTDPSTFAAVTLLLFVVAIIACYIPARRATEVDPIVALRHE